MAKKKEVDLNEAVAVFQQDRYVPIPEAASKIRVSERGLWGWRERCAWDPEAASLFAKYGKFVFFDLDAWARLLAKKQQEGVEAAKAFQNSFRAIIVMQTAAAAAIIATLLYGGGGGF
ncbi:MAG: hypothetical protein KKF77_08445 [Proteobacteria bacterium]|nr:hypothetical protein [Pseudomonadota bacterium]